MYSACYLSHFLHSKSCHFIKSFTYIKRFTFSFVISSKPQNPRVPSNNSLHTSFITCSFLSRRDLCCIIYRSIVISVRGWGIHHVSYDQMIHIGVSSSYKPFPFEMSSSLKLQRSYDPVCIQSCLHFFLCSKEWPFS